MVDGLHRVVVTGLGAVTPIGNTVQNYWSGLTSAANGVAPITLFDAHESGEASDRTSPVTRSRFVSHQERIRLIAPGPPAQQMREIVAAARSAGDMAECNDARR